MTSCGYVAMLAAILDNEEAIKIVTVPERPCLSASEKDWIPMLADHWYSEIWESAITMEKKRYLLNHTLSFS